MNVTQIIQSAVEVKSKGKDTEINSEDFTKAFEKHTAASALKKESPETEDPESEELDKTLPDTNEKSEKESELPAFTLINPFMNLDADFKDIETLGKNFSIHTDPSTSEASLMTVNQLDLSETGSNLPNQTPLINNDLAESLTPEQLDRMVSLTDSEPLIEGQTPAEVVDGVNRLSGETSVARSVASASGSKSAHLDGLEVSDIAVKTDENSVDQQKEPIKVESFSTLTSQSAEGKAEQKSDELNHLLAESEQNEQLSVKESESIQLPANKPETISLEGHREKSTADSNKPAELNTIKTEPVEQTLPEGKVKETVNQTDTDYDFVSMLRQLSGQTEKKPIQTSTASTAETSVLVPKEQGIDFIQDMVTKFVENKEGQKTYQTTLHLTPETLGKVTVELSMNEDGISGKLTFQSDEARRWMEGEWLDLKLPLETKGLSVKSFDFTTSQPSAQQQSGFSFSEQSGGSGQEFQRQSFSGKDASILSESDEQNLEMNKDQTNGLNVYV